MKTKKSKKLITVWIVAAVVAVAAIVVGGYFLLSNSKAKVSPETEGTQEYDARIAEELSTLVLAYCEGNELRPTSGEYSVTDISGNVKTFSVAPAKNEQITINDFSDDIKFLRAPKSVDIKIMFDGKEVFEGTLDEYRKSFTPRADGVYSFIMTAETENAAYIGKATYNFDIKYEIIPRFSLSSETINQGGVMVVYGENLRDEDISITLPFGFIPTVERNGTKMFAVIPFNFYREAGEYTLTIKYGEEEIPLKYTVAAVQYDEQQLTVSEETTSSTIDNSAALAEYNKLIQKMNEMYDSTVYWDERFVQPCAGTITTEFGSTRYINGSTKPSSIHSGIDIACDEGTPVTASNKGKVIYAGELQVSGKTVIIEHGNGLHTMYLHMSALSCKEGDIVEKGQQIGLVGMTGFATGPHLHFEISISGYSLSPWYFFDGTSDIYKIQSYK